MVTNSGSIAVSVPVPASFAVPLLPFLLPLFLALLPLQTAFLLPGSSLGLSLLKLGPLLPFGDLPLLAGNLLLHGLEVKVLLVALCPPSSNLHGVLLVRLGPLDALRLGGLGADLGGAQLTDLVLDGADVDEVFEDGLGVLVDARAIQRAIDEGDGLAALERQELVGVSFDFCLGDFEHCFLDLIAVFLPSTKN